MLILDGSPSGPIFLVKVITFQCSDEKYKRNYIAFLHATAL